MKIWINILIFYLFFLMTSLSYAVSVKDSSKKRILVVSSYHKGYRWSRETHDGLCTALLKFGYFDNIEQISKFFLNDYVETSTSEIKKIWMDTKRKNSKGEIEMISKDAYRTAKDFRPYLIFLGDDNAAQYLGTKFLDSSIPIVFWGVNNTPMKYGLVDSEDVPGHNVTGVYQPGYYRECLNLLKAIVPQVKTFAILSDGTTSGRSHCKQIEHLDRKGALPLKLVETVFTNNYEAWKNKVLKLQSTVDAFFIAQLSGMKDKSGHPVPTNEVIQWYLTHIKIPETGKFVKEGMLCTVLNSGYNQGFEAGAIAHDILAHGANPAVYPPRPSSKGPFIANKKRAKMLDIIITEEMGIEEYVEE